MPSRPVLPLRGVEEERCQNHQGARPQQERVELDYWGRGHPVTEAFHVVSSLPYRALLVAVSCSPEWSALTAAMRAATWAAMKAASKMFTCYRKLLSATKASSTIKQRRSAAIKGSAARSVIKRFIGDSLVVRQLYHEPAAVAQDLTHCPEQEPDREAER